MSILLFVFGLFTFWHGGQQLTDRANKGKVSVDFFYLDVPFNNYQWFLNLLPSQDMAAKIALSQGLIWHKLQEPLTSDWGC